MKDWQIWLIAGSVLMILEIILPGGIVFFLGLSAAIVAGLIYWGIVTSVVNSFILWFMISIATILVLRSLVMKYFEGDSIIENTDEDADNIGQIVEVVESVQPHKDGRIRFLDSTWVARSDDEIEAGSQAIISARDGNIWIISKI